MALLISQNGEQIGPFTDEEVQTEIQNGRVSATDWAWEEGMDDWRPLAEIQRFGTGTPDSSCAPIPENDAPVEAGPPPLPALPIPLPVATQQQITPSSKSRPFLSKRGWLKLIYWALAAPVVLLLLIPAVCSGFGLPLGDEKTGNYPLACLFVGLFLGLPFRSILRSATFSIGVYIAGWALAFLFFVFCFYEVSEAYRYASEAVTTESKATATFLGYVVDYLVSTGQMATDVRDFWGMLFKFIGAIFFKPFPAVMLVAIGALGGPLGKAVMRRLGLRSQ